MSGFDTSWLDLREPADRAARDARLLAAAAAATGSTPGALIVDLGCGTGSTFRALNGSLPAPTAWRFLDNDPALLAQAGERCGAAVDLRRTDLAALGAADLAGARLVTASALFDLVSRRFVEHLAGLLSRDKPALYAALSYDGTASFDEPHPLDGAIVAAFNRHQRSDKGFGPALGPDATHTLSAFLQAVGYRVETVDSPWVLGPDQMALQQATLDGFAQAVAETQTLAAEEVALWHAHRKAAAARGVGCRIGHSDLLAVPPH